MEQSSRSSFLFWARLPQRYYAFWMPLLSPWVRIALRKNLSERGIVTVDVVVEMNQSVLQHDNGCVENQDWNGMCEIHLLGGLALHRSANPLRVPPGIVAQHPRSQVGRPFQPDTAVAEIPPASRK